MADQQSLPTGWSFADQSVEKPVDSTLPKGWSFADSAPPKSEDLPKGWSFASGPSAPIPAGLQPDAAIPQPRRDDSSMGGPFGRMQLTEPGTGEPYGPPTPAKFLHNDAAGGRTLNQQAVSPSTGTFVGPVQAGRTPPDARQTTLGEVAAPMAKGPSLQDLGFSAPKDVPESVEQGLLAASLGFISPENLAITLGTAGLGNGLSALVNSARGVKLLSRFPGNPELIRKAVDMAAAGAVPAAFGTQSLVSGAKAGYRAATTDSKEEATSAGTEAAVDLLFGALGLYGAHAAAKGVAAAHPPAPEVPAAGLPYEGAPVGPTPEARAAAPAISASLQASGRRLAAANWSDLANWGATSKTPFTVKVAGKAITFTPVGARGVQAVDQDGNVVKAASGSILQAQAWLAQNVGRVSGLESALPGSSLGPAGVAMAPAEQIQAVQAERVPSAPAAESAPEVYDTPRGKLTVISRDKYGVRYSTTQPDGTVLADEDGNPIIKRVPEKEFAKRTAAPKPVLDVQPVAESEVRPTPADREAPVEALSPEDVKPPAPEPSAVAATEDHKKETDTAGTAQPLRIAGHIWDYTPEELKRFEGNKYPFGVSDKDAEDAVRLREEYDSAIGQRSGKQILDATDAHGKDFTWKWVQEARPAEASAQPEPTVQKNVDRMESMKPDVAETLAVGSTRVLEQKDGTKFREKLEEIPVSDIQTNPENKMYEEKVQQYVDKPSPVAIEVRSVPDGGYIVHDGHHRFEAEVRRGAKTVPAWVPTKEPEAQDAELAALPTKDLRTEEKKIQKSLETPEDVQQLDAVRQEIVERGIKQLSAADEAAVKIERLHEKKVADYRERFTTGETSETTGGRRTIPLEISKPTTEFADAMRSAYTHTIGRDDKKPYKTFSVGGDKFYAHINNYGKWSIYPGGNDLGRPVFAVDPIDVSGPPKVSQSTSPDLERKSAPEGNRKVTGSETTDKLPEAEPPTKPAGFQKGDTVEWKAAGGTVYRGEVQGARELKGADGPYRVLDVRPEGKKSLATINERMARAAEVEKVEKSVRSETKAPAAEPKAIEETAKSAPKETAPREAETPSVLRRNLHDVAADLAHAKKLRDELQEEKNTDLPPNPNELVWKEVGELKALAEKYGQKFEFSPGKAAKDAGEDLENLGKMELADAKQEQEWAYAVKLIDSLPDIIAKHRNETQGRIAKMEDNSLFVDQGAESEESVPEGLHPKMPRLVRTLRARIANGEAIKNGIELQRIAKEVMGGSVADGTFEMKDAYDALETAVNQHIAEDIGAHLLRDDFKTAIEKLDTLMELLPTQTARNAEQLTHQQFSTPPTLSFLVTKAADIQNGETALEPSAGTGSLAAWAKAAGAKVETNEIAPRRNGLLEVSGYKPTKVNAERLRDMRPDLKPDVVVMNPPFSAAAGRVSSNSNVIGYTHVISALKMLKPGGRLVAILGEGARMDAPNAATFWAGIKNQGSTVRANIGMSGENYKKYGTTFGNRIIIIDKVPAEAGQKPVLGDFETPLEAYDAIKSVIEGSDRSGSGRTLESPAGHLAGSGKGTPEGGQRGAPGGGASPTPDQEAQVIRTLAEVLKLLPPRVGVAPPEEPIRSAREAPGFYSQLERTIEAKAPNRAPAQQVLAIVRNPSNAVKAEEVKWSGIDDWLQSKKGESVTKQEVLDFVKSNEVRLQEVQHGEMDTEAIDARIRELAVDRSAAGLRTAARFEDQAELDRLNEEWNATNRENPPAKYAQYTTPGGTNYRELLLTLPPQRDKYKWTDQEYREVQKLAAKIRGDHGQVATEQDRARFEELRDRQKAANGMDYKSSHWDEPNVLAHIRVDDRTGPDGEKILHVAEVQSDWGQEIRRKGAQPTGAARKQIEEDLAKSEELSQRESTAYANGVEDLKYGKPDRSGERPYTSIQRGTPEWAETMAEITRAERARNAAHARTIELRNQLKTGAPEMPFAKSWHELAFKRALRYAAENGYDALSWDTGETQADRFDISKQISRVEYNPKKKLLRAFDKEGRDVLMRGDVEPESLPDYIGKETAKKLLETAIPKAKLPPGFSVVPAEYSARDNGWKFQVVNDINRPVRNAVGVTEQEAIENADIEGNGVHSLSGVDLKTKAPGMEGFYDKILVDFANKYGKKWGARVEDSSTGNPLIESLSATSFVDRYTIPGKDESGHFRTTNADAEADLGIDEGEVVGKGANESSAKGAALRWAFKNQTRLLEEARIRMKGRGEGEFPAHLMKITPAMRESVMQGQPLFAKGIDGVPSGKPQAKFSDGILWVNSSAMGVISKALRISPGSAGLYLPVNKAAALAHGLVSKSIAPSLAYARASGNGSITVVKWDKGQPISKAKELARHELFHATENWAQKPRSQELMAEPLAQKAARALSELGYEPDQERVLFSEIGAHLVSGPNGWEKLGLSRAEAKELFKKYLSLLNTADIQKMRSVTPLLSQELNAARNLNRTELDAGSRGQTGGTQESAGVGELRGGVRPDIPSLARELDVKPSPGERGAARLELLTGGLLRATEKFASRDPDEPKHHISTRAHLKRVLLPGENLAEVEVASPNVFMDWVQAASHESISSNMIRTAVSSIKRTLSDTGHSFDEMRAAYTQSRLNGIRQRWFDLAQMFEDSNIGQIQESMSQRDENGKSFWLTTLSSIAGKRGLPQDLGQTAAALIERQDWDTLRDFVVETFTDAGDSVEDIMPPDEFEATEDFLENDPKGQAAHALYKENIEAPLAQAHAKNEGVFTEANGELDTYIPLSPFEKEQPGAPINRRAPMQKPRNPNNYFATGLASKGYDVSMEAFSKRITRAVKANNRAAAIQATIDARWARSKPDDWDGTFQGPDGQTYEGADEVASDARTLIKDGRAIRIPARLIIMPRFMHDALRPILSRDRMDDNEISRLAHFLNSLSVQWTPAELVYHGAGLLGALNANTPFLGESGLDKFLSAPLVRYLSILHRVATVDPSSPESIAKLKRMAQAGALPAKTGKVTYDKAYAEEHGVERERSFAPLLYGPSGLDVRTRLVMYDIFEAAFPHGTDRDLYHFVNQLGNYTPELQGSIERWAKRSGLAPFATAGMTRQVNAYHAWTGTGPLPDAKSRIIQMAFGGALGAMAMWLVSYKFLTGEWPTQDKRSKFLMIPVGGGGHGVLDKYRHSTIGDMLWGKGPETGYLSFAFFFPIVARGGRLFGVQGGYEAKQLGGSPQQVIDAAQKDVMNTLAHPFIGPAASAVWVGVTGTQPYLSRIRDQGRPAPGFLPAVPKERLPGFFGGLAPSAVEGVDKLFGVTPPRPQKNAGFMSEAGARTGAAVGELNGFYGATLRHLGVMGADDDYEERGNWIARMGLNLVAPNLVQNSTNPYARANALAKQRR